MVLPRPAPVSVFTDAEKKTSFVIQPDQNKVVIEIWNMLING
jgi:hypothetical protein